MSDEISGKYDATDNQFLLGQLDATHTADDLKGFIGKLEPHDAAHASIKEALQARPDTLSGFQKKQLSSSLQMLRWMHQLRKRLKNASMNALYAVCLLIVI